MGETMLRNDLNILLATMQLGIGGAETHIVELAKELKRRGNNIIVASNGGEYVKELEEADIKHYIVPLQNKNPLNIIKSVSLLKKIIKSEKIDIVHSHARIPSFILGQMHKRMKFPFVTTAHWVFNTGYGLKYITNWGEKTVAVSEDIKEYLMTNYKIPSSDIRVTINGIDTDKFSDKVDRNIICKELGINADDTVITYISRLDESRSLVAKQLIEIVPKLDKVIKNLKVIVVGGGDDFENVKTLTERVNNETGKESVILTGGRTDINNLIAPCELFVGVSRSALEAMSMKKPVIIAGNEGYIGLFDDTKLKVGIDTNFCCRGCEMSNGELLYNDILAYFTKDDEEKTALGNYGRELIKREYSVSRMAEDTQKVYDWALQKNEEILVSGYYGFHNSGDDALLHAIIEDVKKHKESPNIVVLSQNPNETNRIYGVKAIKRTNPIKIFKHMKKADTLLFGGGTLLQNRTSTKSLWYYLMIIALAQKTKTKVMLYANGIGPLYGDKNISITKKILDKVDLITLRDDTSKAELDKIGVTNTNVLVTADPAFNLKSDKEVKLCEILKANNVPSDKKLIGISVRKWGYVCDEFEEIIAKACDYAVTEYGYYPVFLPMQPSKDYAISKNIVDKMENKASIISAEYNVDEMMALVGSMEMCLGMRLHTLIYSLIGAVPLIGLVYDPKIKSFMENTKQKKYISVKDITLDELKKYIDECHSNNDSIKEELKEEYLDLHKKAEMNGRLAVNLYEKGSVEF